MDITTAAPDSTAALPSHTRVLVIGAGFAGLGLAIKLSEQGEQDFLVIERGPDVGGTWRDNTYPGAACDVPSQLYSFSFAPNPDWSRSFSPQPEIQAYLRKVAQESTVLDRFRFDTTVEDAAWDDEAQVWRVVTSAGTVTADLLVSAAGALSDPKMPDIDGIETFQGEVFHSARWNHDFDLTRQARRRHRHRRLVDPDRPRDRQEGRPPRRLPAHRPLGDAAARPALLRPRTARLPPRPGGPEALPHRDLLGPRDVRAGLHGEPEARRARPRSCRSPTSRRASPTPSCARRSRPPSRSAASGS